MNNKLVDLQKLCLAIKGDEFAKRLETIAKFFIGVKYGPWQDGSSLESLDDFNYDLDTLDCVTYVEVVLALTKIYPVENFAQFKRNFLDMLQAIHYAKSVPKYLARNHIHCLDWIANNNSLFSDITTTICPTHKIASTTIDKLSWIKRQKVSLDLLLNFPAHIEQQLQPQESHVPYIESTELLNNYAKYVANFPDCAIVNIVRPNWDLREKIGTHLNISHLGFAIKDQLNNNLKFFHATSEKLQVVQETLDIYMQRQLASPTIKGINVLAIKPEYCNAGK